MQTFLLEENISEAQNAARIFMFYAQFKNTSQQFKLPFKKIRAKSFYIKHKKEFDKLVLIFNKYSLDLTKYIRFFIEVLDKREKDIKADLVSNASITKYIDWLKLLDKQDKVYKWFVKSAKNIAEDSIKLGYFSAKDFLRYLISNKKIAEYFVTGRISVYYFAAIPNFKKIIPKLDRFAKAELMKLYDRFELYNNEITTAFMRKTNYKANPIKFTDDLIYKLRSSRQV